MHYNVSINYNAEAEYNQGRVFTATVRAVVTAASGYNRRRTYREFLERYGKPIDAYKKQDWRKIEKDRQAKLRAAVVEAIKKQSIELSSISKEELAKKETMTLGEAKALLEKEGVRLTFDLELLLLSQYI